MVTRRVLLILSLCVLLLTLLCGCDTGMSIVSEEIVGSPNRIIYIANVDTELDLSGLKSIAKQKSGADLEFSWEVDTKTADSNPQVIHKIDFTKPGVYEVEIYRKWQKDAIQVGTVLSYKFFIQVIDEEIYNKLKEGTK